MSNRRNLNFLMNLLPGSLGSALVSTIAGFPRSRGGPLPRPYDYSMNMAKKMMNQKVPRVGRLRRFGGGKGKSLYGNNSGIEINRAEGGFKRLTDGLTYITRSFDEVYKFIMRPNVNYSHYALEQGVTELNLVTELMNNEEFLTYNLMIVKYKLLGIRISVDYCSVPVVQTVLNKLVLVPTTDLLKDIQGQINKCAMKLDMSHPGVKNFNFNINRRNMNEESVEWITRSEEYPGQLKITLSETAQNHNPLDTDQVLGTFKVSWIVKMALQDVAGTLRKAFGLNKVKLKDKIQELKNGLLPPPNLVPIPKEDDKVEALESEKKDVEFHSESVNSALDDLENQDCH